MSGLAEILLSEGYKVSGTDSKDSPTVNRLRDLGAHVFIGHNANNVKNADLIVYTDAISEDNIEFLAAKKSGITMVDRAKFLGALMKNYKYSIAVSGTHGKTTTTSMLASITNHGNLDPTVLLGGQLDDIGGNVKLASQEYILTEACEYKANILKYFPTMAIILNIDEDHLDYFKSIDHIVETFVAYGKNVDKDGYLIYNADDPYCPLVAKESPAKKISFAIDNEATYKVENLVFSKKGYSSFDLLVKDQGSWPVKLMVMGRHNVYNALASIAAAHTYGVAMDDLVKYIGLYNGVHRRLELKGECKGIKVIDDYAHHPTEIKITLEALKNVAKGKIYCVFQPHTFTRTKALLDGFAESFALADTAIITDIYAAREKDMGEIHSRDLTQSVKEKGANAVYLSSFEEIEDYLSLHAQEDDIIVTMGAGDVYLIGENLIKNKFENPMKITAV